MATKLTIGVIFHHGDREDEDCVKELDDKESDFFIKHWITPYINIKPELQELLNSKDGEIDAEVICKAMMGHVDFLVRDKLFRALQERAQSTDNIELEEILQLMEAGNEPSDGN